MLVVTRKVNEDIRIGEDIVVRVVRVRGDDVRIGVVAPRDVRVMRGELCEEDGQPRMRADARGSEGGSSGVDPRGSAVQFSAAKERAI